MDIGDTVRINRCDKYPDVIGCLGIIIDMIPVSGIGSLQIQLPNHDPVWVWMNAIDILKYG